MIIVHFSPWQKMIQWRHRTTVKRKEITTPDRVIKSTTESYPHTVFTSKKYIPRSPATNNGTVKHMPTEITSKHKGDTAAGPSENSSIERK